MSVVSPSFDLSPEGDPQPASPITSRTMQAAPDSSLKTGRNANMFECFITMVLGEGIAKLAFDPGLQPEGL
jgi:hypothetical protein